MSAYQRVLAYVQRGTGPPILAKFSECIIKSLELSGHSGNVSCELKENKLILGSEKIGNHSEGGLLTHPPFCPIQCMDKHDIESLPRDIAERGVDVGVVVILETSDDYILLTRRARHMRTFPGVWVPPGGHVEDGETLLEAGLRELSEETGLKLNNSLNHSHILCLWESVYPYILSMGQPKRHHVVIYLLAKVADDKPSLQNQLDLDNKEVDAAMWVNLGVAKVIAYEEVSADCPEFISATVINKSGAQETVRLPTYVLTNKAPSEGLDVERISTGTRYAVTQWIEQKR